MDFGVFQKSSKHFLIYILFPPGERGHPLPVPSPLGTSRLEQSGPIYDHFVAKNVFCQYLYTT